MRSNDIWLDLQQQLQQLTQSIKHYESTLQQEIEEMSQCDKFDQDALHLLEFTSFNAAESAKLMKQWRENRVTRRELKGLIQQSQFITPFLQQLTLMIEKEPQLTNSLLAYSIRSERMDAFAHYLYDKGKLSPTQFQPLQQSRPLTPPYAPPLVENKNEYNEPPIYQTSEAEATDFHLKKTNKGWVITQSDALLFQHKKLNTVIEYAVKHNYCIYAPPPYDVTVNGLVALAIKKSSTYSKSLPNEF